MRRWSTWIRILIVVIAGIAPICVAIRSPFAATMPLLTRIVMAAPAGLFLISLLAYPQSERTQWAVTITAGVTGGLFLIALVLFTVAVVEGEKGPNAGGIAIGGLLASAIWLLEAFLSLVIAP